MSTQEHVGTARLLLLLRNFQVIFRTGNQAGIALSLLKQDGVDPNIHGPDGFTSVS